MILDVPKGQFDAIIKAQPVVNLAQAVLNRVFRSMRGCG